MKKTHTRACLVALILAAPGLAAETDDIHPLMTSEYWGNIGVYFSARGFNASARASIDDITSMVDFESSTGLDDHSELFMAEFGWQFTSKWGLAVQHFESDRGASVVLNDPIEWQDLVFEVGEPVDVSSSMEITRLFFARRFRDDGPHSLRLGAGIHWLSIGASIAGQATLDDLTREFRRSVVKADLLMPNVGAWYRYSPSHRWIFNLRADWLSASVGKYKGLIWNAAAGATFSPWDHVGIGINYQFFQLDGGIKEDRWRGDVRTTFTGPVLYVSGYW